MTFMKRKQWNQADAQAFADGARTKAQTFINRRKRDNKSACRKWKWNSVRLPNE